MNNVKLTLAMLISIPNLLFAQTNIVESHKETYPNEATQLRINDFKLFETAIFKPNVEYFKKYFHAKANDYEIKSFFDSLQIGSKYVYFYSDKNELGIWTSDHRKIQRNIITFKSLIKEKDYLNLEYTYNIEDSTLVVYSLSFNRVYENGKRKYDRTYTIPNAYVDYIAYNKSKQKIKMTESFKQYEDKVYRIYQNCKNNGIPFTDSIMAKLEIEQQYEETARELIFTSKNYSYGLKISQRGAQIDPKNTEFWVFTVIAKCILGQYNNDTNEIVLKLKTMSSRISNHKNGFESLLHSIEYLEEHGIKCKEFKHIKLM